MDRRIFLAGATGFLELIGARRSWAATFIRETQRAQLSNAVKAATLAANTFNTQPWLFKLRSERRIDVYADIARNLGAFDPYLRDLHVSIGCAVENLCIAAAAEGLEPAVTLAPGQLRPASMNAKPKRVASIAFRPGPRSITELSLAITRRHTNRHLYDASRDLPPGFCSELQALTGADHLVRMFTFTDEARRAKLADIITAAGKTVSADPLVQRDIAPWVRSSEAQWRQTGDGELIEPPRRGQQRPLLKTLILSGRLAGIIAVRDENDRTQAVRAGRLWQRSHLLATARGLAARPENSAVHLIDYENRRDLPTACAAQVAELTGAPDWHPTLMFYMGYPLSPPTPSPRRPLSAVQL